MFGRPVLGGGVGHGEDVLDASFFEEFGNSTLEFGSSICAKFLDFTSGLTFHEIDVGFDLICCGRSVSTTGEGDCSVVGSFVREIERVS